MLNAQSNLNSIEVRDTFRVNLENSYKLRSTNIIPFSESILIGERKISGNDYIFNYRLSRFSLNDSLQYSIFDTIIVTYQTVLLELQKVYKRRTLITRYDDRYPDSIQVIKTESSPLTTEAIFGKDIRRSGSLIRGFTVGTNKDFSVNSGLRLQLSGKLADDIEIVAALTDENTPIQPEGNTERLEELDKVFIEIRHPNAIGTFGDFELNESNGEFGRLNRKLQGLKGQFNYSGYGGTAAFASSRGKFNTNQINGDDGNQGPYRLSGINNEQDIIVIAGSEKVFLDGEELKRGENNDYVIEYANGEVTFTPNRLITSASRITIDFEYTDRQFQRNFLGVNFNGKLFDDKFSFGINFFREADDENSPIDISISDAEKDILSVAGDDRNKAVRDGAVLAEPDSLGRIIGSYAKIDTLIEGNDFTYYLYRPGDPGSEYNVTFSFVGFGEGDYIRESIGRFRFVGIGEGSYLPVRFIPLAESRQVGNVVMNAEVVKGLNLSLELAGSIWDRNNFSDLDDDDNSGFARNVQVSFNRKGIDVGAVVIPELALSIRDRFVDSRFVSLDRFNSIEFERDYNSAASGIGNEVLREASFMIKPADKINLNTSYGFLKKGERFSSDRLWSELNVSKYNNVTAAYKYDNVKTTALNTSSSWNKQNGFLKYAFGYFVPGIEFLYENREDKTGSLDSLTAGSLRYREISPTFDVAELGGLNLSAKYSVREESFPVDGKLTKESDAKTQSYSIQYRGIKQVTSDLSISFRDKKFTQTFKERGSLDNETVLIKSQTRFNVLKQFLGGNVFYEASTQKTARLEKVFIRVQQGQGNYIYLGDLNENGIADEEEFEPTLFEGDYILSTVPTDELFPIIDLKLNARFKLDFEKVITGKTFLANVLKPLSTETTFRVEEKSKTEKTSDIYLLNFSKFLNDSTTIRGFNIFQQDLNLFNNSNAFSIRFRFLERNNINQFSNGIEKGFFNERSLRLKFRLVKEINNQTDIVLRNEDVLAPSNLNRSRKINGTDISTDFSYHPFKSVEVGFRFKVGETIDNFPEQATEITSNSQLLRFTLSFAGRGRLRIEGERDELTGKNTFNTIPFEITRGKVIGKNYLWRLNFDYRITTNLQTSLAYNGRKQGAGDVIHTLRAEARAFF